MKNRAKNNYKLIAASILCALIGSAFAQEAGVPAAQENAKRNDIEEVVILGQTQQDLAMSAFRSGDFVTAEKNFLRNAKCALRRERSQESLVENQQIGLERAITNQNAQSIGGGSSSGPPSGASVAARSAAAAGATAGISSSSQSSSGIRAEEGAQFTCDNRGFQLYMAGLSQIQLGQHDQALGNFKRATTFSKTLYDAHYRIGLISLMNNDVKESRIQLKKIGAIMKRCKKNCNVKNEIEMRHAHLKSSIKKSKS